MTSPLNPSNWYWFVAGDTTQVYSSATGVFVPISDATFVAWQTSTGFTPASVESNATLGNFLSQQNAPRPVDNAVLTAWQAGHVSAMDMVQFQVLFNHENRIRTLAGQQTITVAQFKAGIMSLL